MQMNLSFNGNIMYNIVQQIQLFVFVSKNTTDASFSIGS